MHAEQERGDSAPQDELASIESSERLMRALGRGLLISLVTILIAVAGVFGVVILSSQSLDRYAEAKSREQVQRLLDLELEELANRSRDYSWWNEAVELVIYQRDTDWAMENVSGYLQNQYGTDWVVSLDREATLIHGVHKGTELEALPEGLLTAEFKQLMAEAIDTDFADPEPASDILDIQGAPALVAVSPYVAYDPTPYATDQAHGYLILVNYIDEAILGAWRRDFQIEALRLLPAAAAPPRETGQLASLPLATPSGEPLGTLQWRPEHPGQSLLTQLLPWVIGGVLLILAGSLFFYRRLRAYGRLAHGHLMELSTSRELLFRQANYDFLTGLANRSLFIEHLNHELARCIRHKLKAGVLYVDLDGFKAVNDTLGHTAGDELLCWVAKSMAKLVRTEDDVARFGGDEFCLLLTDVASEEDVSRVVDKIHALLAGPVEVGGKHMLVGASIGIAMIPDDTQDLSDVFRYADIAMYQAKSRGTNLFCFYDATMEERSQ